MLRDFYLLFFLEFDSVVGLYKSSEEKGQRNIIKSKQVIFLKGGMNTKYGMNAKWLELVWQMTKPLNSNNRTSLIVLPLSQKKLYCTAGQNKAFKLDLIKVVI